MEYPVNQLIHLGRLEIYVDHLIVNFDVRILVQVHYVVIVSLSLFMVARTYLYARRLCF